MEVQLKLLSILIFDYVAWTINYQKIEISRALQCSVGCPCVLVTSFTVYIIVLILYSVLWKVMVITES